MLLTVVAPGSNAARARLKVNDVLLRYGDTELKELADLLKALSQPGRKGEVPVTFWREARPLSVTSSPASSASCWPANRRKALAERRKQDRRLAQALRGGTDDKWDALPGTRAEVEALRRLFDGKPRLLFDSQGSEQRLDELAAAGALAKYRYLHLATHGIVDNRFPLNSAVILSRDALPGANKQLDAGLPVYCGKLTVRAVLRRWHLKSELVTLSACQTALGKSERGEGFVGFAQALILASSRSVCLSLWKVDDAATALLMEALLSESAGQACRAEAAAVQGAGVGGGQGMAAWAVARGGVAAHGRADGGRGAGQGSARQAVAAAAAAGRQGGPPLRPSLLLGCLRLGRRPRLTACQRKPLRTPVTRNPLRGSNHATGARDAGRTDCRTGAGGSRL